MKKFLSFLTAILFASSMMAADYVKVTEAPTDWSGDYLFVYEAENVAFNGGLATLDAAANTIAVEITDGKIAATDATNAAKFTLAAVEGGYSVQSASGKFIGVGSYGNGLKQADAVGSYVHNSLTIDESGNAIIGIYNASWNTTGGTMILNFNANKSDKRFRYYKDGSQKKIQLYKYETSQGGGEGGETISTVKTVYCKCAQAWWKQDNAAVGVYAFAAGGVENAAWPGVRMTTVEGEDDLWKADIDTAMYAKIIFTRMNPSDEGNQDWGAKTADLEIPADKDLYTITSTAAVWGDPGVTGEWSVYGEGGDTPEPPTPVEAAYYLVGSMNNWQAAEAYKFAAAETEGEYLLHTTLAVDDEIKVIKVEGETTTWYPAEGGNYVVDAAHAGEKDIYFRPAGNEAWAEFGGYIWMGENQPAPVADFTQPFTLKFNGTGESGKDNSAAFAADVAAIFDAASAPYVASVETATKVYAGRPIADDNSSVKFGTSSAAGSLAFTLAQAIEVDSIIVNATQYGNNAAKITVNGTEFDLTAGNKVPQDSKITPEGAISVITIAQSGTERIYLRNVRVYPKTQGGDTPEQPEEVVLPVVKLAGSLTSWDKPVLMANAEDSLSATLTLDLGIDHYQLKVVSDDNWLTRAGEGDLFTMHREYPHVDHLNLINSGDNIKLITDVEGEYTFTWTYADSSLVVTFPAAPAQPKFYITGNEDIVGEGNPTWGKNGALESFSDTLVMNLAAGFHKFKLITPTEQWLGMEALTDTAYGLSTDGDTNICFTLAEAGEVTVIYNATEFKVEGDFYIAPVANYYLIGDSAFVVDAGATADKAWTPDAIPCLTDTTVLNLKAGQDYIMRLSLNGTWENHRDFRHLTDTAAGLIELPDEYQNRSIGFRLNEAGPVTIIYIPAAEEQPEVFKLIGNFYVAPAPDPTVAVKGSMNDWAEEIPFVLSDDKTYASLTVENIGAGDYDFKFIINGEWRSNGYTYHRGFPGAAGITENNKANMIFQADQDGEYTFYWYFANDSAAIVYPEYIEPAKEYYAKYAPAWEWVKLTEAEGLWLTDTIVYKGTGVNINDAAADENNMFYSNEEIEGALPIVGAEFKLNDTIRFSFNPADSVVTAIMIAEYVAPDPTASVRLEIMDWNETPFILAADKQSASLTIEDIHKGNYAFKMFINGEWRSNAGTISRENPAAIVAGNEEGNMTLHADIDGIYTFTWFFANDSLVALFPEKPEVPMTEIRLVPGVWNVEGVEAKFAAVTWNEGEVMEDGVVSDWFVGTDTVVGNIPAAADSIGFARFNGEAAAPSIEDQSIIWNHTDKMLIDKETMIYTITGWPEEGKDYCPGYWGEYVAPVYDLENGFYLVGNKYNWTPAAERLFTANPETEGEYFLAEVTLEENDSIKVVMVVNDEITDWYPNGDNYVVDAAHAGVKDIYFNPTYQEAWGNNIYIEANAAPFACDWENIAWLDGSNEQIKVCKESDAVSVVNVQNPHWSEATEDGIYMTFPSAAWGEISLPEGKYETQGAGILVYLSALTQEYNEISIVCQDVEYIINVYNAANAPKPEYYLVGTLNKWTALEAYKFGVDETCAEGEFILHATLTAGDEIKVIGILGNDTTWFPAEANYSIDDAHAGEAKAIYFRPQYHEDWAAFGGYFWIGENQALLDAPDAAPADPTYEGYQVKAVYSAKYNADCNFGEWGSGTQLTQEEFGKKYVTTNMGYFGLEFTGMDCSEMEALHLDVWVAADASIRIVPIHGGTEVGVTAQLQGQQWNAIDIALTEFAGVTNWSNVYQIKIDNASNLTFWLNNVYFYTTQEKTVDLVDGYYLIGNINGWDIHNLTADHLFAVNPDNEAEYKLHYTLAEGNEFKVVAVANNELGAWYPGEAGNYVVDFAHAGENDIYFRPDYQGGADWHAGCIYVAVDESQVNPWETWFAVGDTWNTETESYLEWEGENQKATIHINVDKNGQWRAQAKYHGPVAEEGKCYHVALKMKANNAINNVTVKYQDNVEMVYVSDAALAANVEFVFDTIVAGLPNGNGIMVLDFGFAHAGDIIEIYDVVIEETECPATRLEDGFYLIGLGMADWTVDYITADYLFTVNPANEGEYMLNTTLAKDQQFKVVSVANDAIVTWYPDGMDNNYIVDENHYGATTVYFRPDGQGGEGWHYGMIYVAPVDHTAIDNLDTNAPAVKILRDGQILIIKGSKTFNAQGLLVK